MENFTYFAASDIHGNIQALDEIIRLAEEEKADRLFIALRFILSHERFEIFVCHGVLQIVRIKIWLWINPLSVLLNSEVEMSASAAAGGTHVSDDLPGGDNVPYPDSQ